MTKYENLLNDLKTAMKSGDREKTNIIRYIISEVKKEAVDSGSDRENINDELTLKVLDKAQKSRKDAIRIFTEQNRPDLAESEQKELDMIKGYLPEEISDAELEAIVSKVKSENPNLQGMAIMGKVMPFVKGKADPDRIKKLI